ARFDGAPSAISANGQLIAHRLPDGSLVVRDVASGTIESAPLPVILPQVLSSFDDRKGLLAVGDDADKQVHVMNWRTGVEVADPVSFSGLALPRFVDDGRLFIGTSTTSSLVDLSVANTGSVPFLPAFARRFTSGHNSDLQFSADGRVVRTSE